MLWRLSWTLVLLLALQLSVPRGASSVPTRHVKEVADAPPPINGRDITLAFYYVADNAQPEAKGEEVSAQSFHSQQL